MTPLAAAPIHLECRLDWLVARTGITQPRADRRLNGIENVIAQIARPWRDQGVVEPQREIRMAASTLAAMVGWVEREERAEGMVVIRLRAYANHKIRDERVPDGWVRVLLISAGARTSVRG